MKMLRILILLAFAGISLATPALAQTGEYIWGKKEWGSNPFSLKGRDDAIVRVDEGVNPMRMPEGAKALLKDEVRRNPQGTPHSLRDNDTLRDMQSGSGPERRPTRVRAPDGIVPAATSWEVTYEGKVYVLVLPDVCFNWTWFSKELPRPREVTPPPEDCAELFIPVQPGDKLSVTYLPKGYLPPRSACFGFKQGDGPITVQPCLTCFDVTTNGVTAMFSLEAITHDIGICIVRAGKKTCMMIVNPTDWVGNKFSLDLKYWKWESEGCPTGKPEDIK